MDQSLFSTANINFKFSDFASTQDSQKLPSSIAPSPVTTNTTFFLFF